MGNDRQQGLNRLAREETMWKLLSAALASSA